MPPSVHEKARLEALARYEVLDTPPEQAFDDLTALAAQICGMPIALVSLVDSDRQWFKSRVGLDATETSREVAFCTHAIEAPDDVLVVNDAARDERFAHNPLVTGEPHIRSYVGAVLRTPDRQALGTLCVIDRVPRTLSAGQVDALRRLGRQVVGLLELRHAGRDLRRQLQKKGEVEQELRASERLYRGLVEHVQGLICVHEMDGRLRLVNEGASRLLGLPRDQLVGALLGGVVPAAARADYERYLAHMQGAAAFEGLLTVARRDGQPAVLAYSAFKFDSPFGAYVVGHGVDITDRAKAEEANRRFASVLETIPDFVGFTDLQGHAIYVNRGGRVMCGLSEDDLAVGRTVAVHPPRMQATVEQAMAHALAHGSWSGQNVLLHRDGQETPVLETVVAPRNVRGEVEFVATIGQDISERLNREERLRVSERRFRHVVENVKEVLFETDLDGQFTFLNEAWTEITGYAVATSLGQPVGRFVHADDGEEWRRRFASLVIGSEDAYRHESRYVHQDGRVLWIELHARLVAGDDGMPRGTAGTLRDVTEQRALSDALVQARERAQRASEQMSAFVASISHELRTPLNGVLGLTGALAAAGLPGDLAEYAARAHDSGQVLLALVNDLLDLSKIEAGRMTLEDIAFDVRRVATDAVAAAADKAQVKNVGFAVSIADEVPPSLLGDPLRLRQILANLADNAVKFTARGGVTVGVTVEGEAADRRLRVEVTDTGVGIPASRLSAIFDKFTQADNAVSRQYGGTGLGLAICRELIALMRGAVGVDSVQGTGTTFWFELPLRVAGSPAAGMAAEQPAAPQRRRAARVLVVDDNPTNRLVARLLLEQAGCSVELAVHGQDALDRLSAQRFDAIFLDGQMPVLDGYETTERIRNGTTQRDIPIIAMTANAMAGDRERCLAAGMSDYLTKPLQPAAVAAALDRALMAPAEAAEETGSAMTESDAGQSALFDLSAVLEIAQGADVMRLVQVLARDLQRYADALDTETRAADWAAATKTAHTIAGAAANVYAMDVVDRARELETMGRTADLAGAPEVSALLQAAVRRLVSALEEWEQAHAA